MPSSNSNILVKSRALIDVFLCTKSLGFKGKRKKCSNYRVSITELTYYMMYFKKTFFSNNISLTCFSKKKKKVMRDWLLVKVQINNYD